MGAGLALTAYDVKGGDPLTAYDVKGGDPLTAYEVNGGGDPLTAHYRTRQNGGRGGAPTNGAKPIS